MNIKIRLEHIQSNIIRSLSSDKDLLLKEFLSILQNSAFLLKSDQLSFWIHCLKVYKSEEIPVTKIGVKTALEDWKNYIPTSKHLLQKLYTTSEYILVYWTKEDLCKMQGQFYFIKT
jgi:hypothetical protein